MSEQALAWICCACYFVLGFMLGLSVSVLL